MSENRSVGVFKYDANQNKFIVTTSDSEGQEITVKEIPIDGGGGGASALEELTDVTIVDKTDGQGLFWNEEQQKWINKDVEKITMIPASKDTLGGVIIGDGINVDSDGKISVNGGGTSYELPAATAEKLGGIKVGEGLTITSDGTLSVHGGEIPITIDKVLDKTSENAIANKPVAEKFEAVDKALEELIPYTLPIASAEVLGGVMIGDNITISEDGKISAPAPTPEYNLPIASNEVLGGIKVGQNLTIDENGVLNAKTGGASSATDVTYDDTITQMGVNNVQIAIEYLKVHSGGGGGGSSYPIISKSEFDALTIEEIQQKGIFGIRTGYEIKFIDGSYYYESYPLIPVLTSNTGENGVASCPLSSPLYNGKRSSTISYAWHAFTEDNSQYLEYYGENQSGAWCRYDFNEPIHLKSMTAKIGHYNTSNVFNYFLQYLKNGTEDEWITVGEGIHTGATSVVEHKLDDIAVTSAVRFYSTTNKTSGTNIFLYNLQAYGYV